MANELPPKVRISFISSCLLLLLIFVLSLWSLNRLIKKSDWVEHTNQVLLKLENILSLLKDAETGQRGYLLTQEEEFLDPYIGSYYNTIQRYKDLRELTIDNPTQQAKLDSLNTLISQRFILLNRNIEAEKSGKATKVEIVNTSRQGKQVMDQIRRLVKRMQQEELRLKDIRYDQVRTSSLITPAIMVSATLLTLMLAIFAYRTTRKAMREASRSHAELARTNQALAAAQEKLRNLNLELERKVAERTEHLWETQTELAQQNQKLTRTNADLDSFIYTASHDLKTPITNMEGIVYALKDSPCYGEEEPRLLIGMLEKSAQQLREVIEGLATVVSIQHESDRHAVQTHNDLREVTEEVYHSIANLIQETRAEITFDLQDRPSIFFPRPNLRSVLFNLIQNAIKYRSPDRPPRIHLSSKAVGDYTRLSVQDNGIGINPGSKDRIFELFKKLHNQVEGTGIGLFIVKRIMENAGGRIEVESEPGKGTTFHLYFPAGPEN